MLILGIETATEQVSVAIGGHEGVLGLFEVTRGRRHAETLVPAIEFLCRQADIEIAEFGAIAVDVGPGLFTGMRVGIATGKAMAQALRIPMIGISSLDLLAFPLRHSDRLIASVIDARRGEVFYARGQDAVCVGDGALRYRDQIVDSVRVDFAEQYLSHPSAAPLVQLAHAKAMREDWVNHSALAPLYLRRPDAQINWETRSGRVS